MKRYTIWVNPDGVSGFKFIVVDNNDEIIFQTDFAEELVNYIK